MAQQARISTLLGELQVIPRTHTHTHTHHTHHTHRYHTTTHHHTHTHTHTPHTHARTHAHARTPHVQVPASAYFKLCYARRDACVANGAVVLETDAAGCTCQDVRVETEARLHAMAAQVLAHAPHFAARVRV
eukprot:3775509-Rhodomonas_salina.1